jgi:uncharacterized protein
VDRVFLDSNVLFSAAYAPRNCFLELWQRPGIRLLSSDYAVEEARRNLATVEHRQRLDRLLSEMTILRSSPATLLTDLPSGVSLPEKDRPILAEAINTRATHLLTGDRRHFGRYFGRQMGGVLIQPPAQYLRGRLKRSKGV